MFLRLIRSQKDPQQVVLQLTQANTSRTRSVEQDKEDVTKAIIKFELQKIVPTKCYIFFTQKFVMLICSFFQSLLVLAPNEKTPICQLKK